MLVRWSLLFFLAALAAPASAQPSVSELQNNYSYTQPGLPNYGISPGSLFIIKGSNLATTTNTNEAFPLTTNLNGTSVSVTVNGVTTQPTLYYILPTQIGAVLQEGTPPARRHRNSVTPIAAPGRIEFPLADSRRPRFFAV